MIASIQELKKRDDDLEIENAALRRDSTPTKKRTPDHLFRNSSPAIGEGGGTEAVNPLSPQPFPPPIPRNP
jgi:hypothetical protein